MNKHFKFPFWNQELEHAVDDFMKSIQVDNTKDFGWAWNRPLANIEESENALTIYLAAPGLTKGDFKLSLSQNILKVEVDKVKPETPFNKIKTEYSYYKFSRNFKVNENINTDAISAAYENGILIITLPKKVDAAKEPKTINIL
ncbi:MAG: Hsp20/alpha crystallin family protein [Saprospiraceae bacterium]